MVCSPFRKKTMKMKAKDLRLYAITDRRWHQEKPIHEMVEEAIAGGATMIQLREKELQGTRLKEEACRVQAVCRKSGIPFIINDNVELAIKIGADGVHVGQKDENPASIRQRTGKNFIMGVTAKTVAQAKTAEAQGADYLGSGAVFGTTSKTDALPMDLQRLQEICRVVSLPVVAIGGIDKDNVGLLSGLGVAGVAVVSGIFKAENIRQAAAALVQQMNMEKGWKTDD